MASPIKTVAYCFSKRKIEDFLATLNGFKVATKIAKKFKDVAKKFK